MYLLLRVSGKGRARSATGMRQATVAANHLIQASHAHDHRFVFCSTIPRVFVQNIRCLAGKAAIVRWRRSDSGSIVGTRFRSRCLFAVGVPGGFRSAKSADEGSRATVALCSGGRRR